jgi:hypothetical protein
MDGDNPLVKAGADDDYGAYFQTNAKFGCILFERSERVNHAE